MMISEATRKLDTCKKNLFRYMSEQKPAIKPYGNFTSEEFGFTMWGERKGVSNKYYIDLRCLKVWTGGNGWKVINHHVDKEVVTPRNKTTRTDYYQSPRRLHPFKAIYNGVEEVYEDAKACADSLGIDVTYVYQMARNGKTYKGISFEKLPLVELEEVK